MAIGYRACESSLLSLFVFYIQNQCFRDTVVPVPYTLVLLTIWSIYVSSGVSSDVLLSPLVADAL